MCDKEKIIFIINKKCKETTVNRETKQTLTDIFPELIKDLNESENKKINQNSKIRGSNFELKILGNRILVKTGNNYTYANVMGNECINNIKCKKLRYILRKGEEIENDEYKIFKNNGKTIIEIYRGKQLEELEKEESPKLIHKKKLIYDDISLNTVDGELMFNDEDFQIENIISILEEDDLPEKNQDLEKDHSNVRERR